MTRSLHELPRESPVQSSGGTACSALPDTTFSGDGWTTAGFAVSAHPDAVLIVDGAIVMGGSIGSGFGFARYERGGAPIVFGLSDTSRIIERPPYVLVV